MPSNRARAAAFILAWLGLTAFMIHGQLTRGNVTNLEGELRRPVIGLYNYLSLVALGQPQQTQVLAGKDGWLFYAPPGWWKKPLTQEQLEGWKAYIEGSHDWFARHGIRYVLIGVPDKQTLYPEKLPHGVTPVPALRQLEEYLAAHSSVEFINLSPTLLGVKSQQDAFYRGDTHWTHPAALAVYRRIVQVLGPEFGEPLQESDLEAERRVSHERDLPSLLSVGLPLLAEQQTFYTLPRPASEFVEGMPIRPSRRQRIVFSRGLPRTDLPNMLAYHDSFVEKLWIFLSQHFDRASYIRSPVGAAGRYKKEDIEASAPDVLLDEIREFHLLDRDPPKLDEWMVKENAEAGD